MSWLLLCIAGLFEIGWAIGLKFTFGFTRLWASIGAIGAMIISLGLLGLSLRTLPVSIAYPVWVGIGAVGTVLVGITWLGESMHPLKLAGVAFIVIGVIALKFAPA